MDLLLIAKPGMDLYSILHNSETAWQAIRFYEHKNLGYGVLISVLGCRSALTLASDLRYYIRRYVSCHLFRIEQTDFYATPLLVASRYTDRTKPFDSTWRYRITLIIMDGDQSSICMRYKKEGVMDETKNEEFLSIIEEYRVLCTMDEWERGEILSGL
jgi:hypothetical protein